MTRSTFPRLNWLMAALLVVVVLALDVPNELLSRMAYAVERGQIQADSEQLGRAGEVSQAFRLVARVARAGVVNIKASAGEEATGEWEQLDARERELKLRQSEIEKLLEAGEEVDRDRVWELFELQRNLKRDRESLHERLVTGTGSGIVYDDLGHILTNSHVVDARSEITVQLADQREYRARLVGADPESDVALLKIDATDLHPLAFGDSDQMEVGDWVLAVGAPFGLSQSVTHGIVSARGRTNINTGARRIIYQDFIQTDAAINPGNSGGPLMNLQGQVIGVNTAIATNGDAYNAGIAFTIPSKMAVKIAEQLKQNGEVARGWLGVTMGALDAEDMDVFDAPNGGVLVTSVLGDSPAAQAGFQVEDVVVAINEHPVRADDEMLAVIADIFPGEAAPFDVIRAGKAMRLSTRLGRRPANVQATRQISRPAYSIPLAGLGAEVQTLLPSAAEFNRFERGDAGAYVIAVDADSAELRQRDLIIEFNNAPVTTAGRLAEMVEDVKSGGRMALKVKRRDGEVRTISLRRP
jgi:serine protease Do